MKQDIIIGHDHDIFIFAIVKVYGGSTLPVMRRGRIVKAVNVETSCHKRETVSTRAKTLQRLTVDLAIVDSWRVRDEHKLVFFHIWRFQVV